MLFFLWGVFRGQKNNSLHQVSNNPEKSYIPHVGSLHPVSNNPEKSFIPQVGSSISTDKMPSAEDLCSLGSVDKVLFFS